MEARRIVSRPQGGRRTDVAVKVDGGEREIAAEICRMLRRVKRRMAAKGLPPVSCAVELGGEPEGALRP